MTEASDRIYQEVGDEAEIIWGQTFDEELGDEMRITVIATGIGEEEPALAENMHRFDPKPAQAVAAARPAYAGQAYAAPAQEARQPASRPMEHPMNQSVGQKEVIARGVVRDATEADLANWNEFDNPVKVTQKRVVGDENFAPDYGMNFDNDDLEVPTFLRRKAD
jgi:cell division protein FtsZ